jgi:hypothetical protein
MCIRFIDTILNKIVGEMVNGYEYFAIEQNKFSNIYGYLANSKVEYANISLTEKLLDKLEETDISSKIGMAKGLLLPLYFASNNTIKERLKTYLLQIDATNEKQEYNRIPFYLSLAVYNIKQLGDDNLQELENYIGQYSNNNSFNSVLYTIDSQLDYILKSNPNERLKNVSGILKEIITRYRSVKEMSII